VSAAKWMPTQWTAKIGKWTVYVRLNLANDFFYWQARTGYRHTRQQRRSKGVFMGTTGAMKDAEKELAP
jgi:hypothetical protein